MMEASRDNGIIHGFSFLF